MIMSGLRRRISSDLRCLREDSLSGDAVVPQTPKVRVEKPLGRRAMRLRYPEYVGKSDFEEKTIQWLGCDRTSSLNGVEIEIGRRTRSGPNLLALEIRDPRESNVTVGYPSIDLL